MSSSLPTSIYSLHFFLFLAWLQRLFPGNIIQKTENLVGIDTHSLNLRGPTTIVMDGTQANPLNPACRTAGIRMIPVVNGKYKVWTKRIGGGGTKVLLLHGGPGFNHEYFECFEDFLPPAGFEMYYYDQLGCCNSDLADGSSHDMSLWTLPRYLEEVEEVRQGLGLEDFVIVGHSWGGILAIEYALKHQNDGHLRAIVVSSEVSFRPIAPDEEANA